MSSFSDVLYMSVISMTQRFSQLYRQLGPQGCFTSDTFFFIDNVYVIMLCSPVYYYVSHTFLKFLCLNFVF